MRKQGLRKRLFICLLTAMMICGTVPGSFAMDASVLANGTSVKTDEEAMLQAETAYVTLSGNVTLSGKDLTDKEFHINIKIV